RPPFAFLYGYAALPQGYRGERDVELLTKLFEDAGAAEAFYCERGWDLAKIERLFLERWAEKNRGFPEVLGPDYPARCEQLLLAGAKSLDAAGKPEQARATIDLLRRLIPPSAASFDQLAHLAWVRGEVDETARLLQEWVDQAPAEPMPRLRIAIVEQ